MSINYAPTYARDKTMFLGSKGYWFTSHERELGRGPVPRRPGDQGKFRPTT